MDELKITRRTEPVMFTIRVDKSIVDFYDDLAQKTNRSRNELIGLARKLGVTRASVNAWEMELSAPTAQYLVALAQLFHTTTDDILGLESEEQIVLRDMNEQEKRLVYDLVSYIAARKETVGFSGKVSKNNPSEKNPGEKGSAVKKS